MRTNEGLTLTVVIAQLDVFCVEINNLNNTNLLFLFQPFKWFHMQGRVDFNGTDSAILLFKSCTFICVEIRA